MTGKEEKWLTQSPIPPPSWEEQTSVLSFWTDIAERPYTKDTFIARYISNTLRTCAIACGGEATFTAERGGWKYIVSLK